jgi:ADP-ribosylglycohydrolase
MSWRKPNRQAIAGCLVGGAIGDAVGGVVERGDLSLSDDTQLSLATCEAMLEVGGVSPEAIAKAFLRHYRERKLTHLGASTLKALRDLDAGAHWALSGRKGDRSAGNGAAMRIAPLGFSLDVESESDRVTVRDVCRITHHSDEAYLGALAVLLAMRHCPTDSANDSANDADFFDTLVDALPDSRVRDQLEVYQGIPRENDLATIAAEHGSSGYVAHTVPLALYTARRIMQQGFGEVLAEAAKLPGDMDTICSIAGQVAGYYTGLDDLPAELVSLAPVLPAAEAATRFANALALDE